MILIVLLIQSIRGHKIMSKIKITSKS